MAQSARPSADTFIGGYTDELGGTAAIFQSIDEVVPSDADYIQSADEPANAPYVTKLTALTDPVTAANHVVRYRYLKSEVAGPQVDLTVELRQGYVNEGSPGMLVASRSHLNITGTVTAGAFTLASSEANSITDYTDLYLRFVFNQM